MIRDFMLGARYLARGFRRINEPGLRRYVWLPLVVNVAVFAVLFWLGAEAFQDLVGWLLPSADAVTGNGWWSQTLGVLITAARWLLWPVFLLAAGVVAFYTFTVLANLIGAPFNEFLAERVERLATAGRQPADSGGNVIGELAGSITDELRKQAYFAVIAVVLLLLFLVPVIQLAAPVAWAAFGAWAAGLEYLDYPLGNHGLRFREQRRGLGRRRMLVLGFGAAVMVMTLIPLLNLLVMPSAVIGATMLWVEELGGRLPGSSLKKA